MEEHYEIPVEEAQPEEQQQPATAEAHETEVMEQQQPPTAEAHETEVMEQQQEKVESGKKPFTSPKAIRLATISKLLEKQTTQMSTIRQMVQPLQKQLRRHELNSSNRCIPSSRLQKQMSQVQKESQKIRSLVSKKKTFSTKKITSTKKKSTKKK